MIDLQLLTVGSFGGVGIGVGQSRLESAMTPQLKYFIILLAGLPN